MPTEVEYAAPNVERRSQKRHRARTKVRIKTKMGKMKFCQAVNLSSSGVAIATTDLGLIKGESVELLFVINLGTVQKLHKRAARVAYVHDGITGFSMESYFK